MRVLLLAGLLAGLLINHGRAAKCSSNLLIDDFSEFSSQTNSLGTRASDDDSMVKLTASDNSIIFTPEKMSYFYETLPCTQAAMSGYDAISFTMTAPKGASFMLEIQTRESCSAPILDSAWHTVGNFTGQEQTIVVPLESFKDANLEAITAFNWATWSKVCKKNQDCKLSNIQLTCGGS
ncbi:uncharacterized protein BCR38DRAFT_478899 [Pseudomassariella vexata]|uniref:Uncharacterized protein n=1 Tax=Pseudomassariella vexata TaxID=1141098 RepID=A0A1Y2DA28_9PEZI|nr:uncharacterized protein BCR38DRAFT_478899 [Pseudomassariella vexata]ORY56128.1 hypothetical protein BCR38DRAFT_478899 [Pseudomassariella vexata]